MNVVERILTASRKKRKKEEKMPTPNDTVENVLGYEKETVAQARPFVCAHMTVGK